MEQYEDSGTTQKKDVKKTPGRTLPSTLSDASVYELIYTKLNF